MLKTKDMIRIYTKKECPWCAQVVIPEGVNATFVDIEENYKGFVPTQVPIVQLNNLNLAGPEQINGLLNIIKKAQDGEYL